nr:MAG TPA: hypothetical protein [Caudoviricetes sp.]
MNWRISWRIKKGGSKTERPHCIVSCSIRY